MEPQTDCPPRLLTSRHGQRSRSASAVTGRPRAGNGHAYHPYIGQSGTMGIHGQHPGRLRVLVVDDDPDVLASLERGLRLSGFEVSTAVDGAEALRSATERAPTQSFRYQHAGARRRQRGHRVARDGQRRAGVCARPAVRSTTAGRPGSRADDYLVKPFVLAELVSGSRRLLPPRATATFSSETIQVGPLEVDIPGRRARVNGVDVDLTKREFDLLAVRRAQDGGSQPRPTAGTGVGLRLRRRHQRRRRFHRLPAAQARGRRCAPTAAHRARRRLRAPHAMTSGRAGHAGDDAVAHRPSHPVPTHPVAFATAIGAAIVVTIVGTIVWIGITNDRLERLDRRLDEVAGFAVPFVPRGLDQIPPSPNVRDVVITVHRGSAVRSNSNVVLPYWTAIMRPRPSTACATGCARWRCPTGAGHPAGRRHLQRHHRRHQQPASARADHLHARHRGRRVAGLAAGDVRGAPFRRLAQQTRAIDAGDVTPDIDVSGAWKPSRSARRSRVCWNASGPSRAAPKPRWPRPATSPRCRRTSCARR